MHDFKQKHPYKWIRQASVMLFKSRETRIDFLIFKKYTNKEYQDDQYEDKGNPFWLDREEKEKGKPQKILESNFKF